MWVERQILSCSNGLYVMFVDPKLMPEKSWSLRVIVLKTLT